MRSAVVIFPLVSCNTRETHGFRYVFMAALFHVVITLLDVYSLEYRIELKLFVVYLIVHNYDSVLATIFLLCIVKYVYLFLPLIVF